MTHKRFFIYILSNPLTQKAFYVGCTSCPKVRRKQHYLRFASEFYGLPPVFTVIDTIDGFGLSRGLCLERYWINKYVSEGHELVNQREVKHRAFNVDYKSYREATLKSTVLNYKTIPEMLNAA